MGTDRTNRRIRATTLRDMLEPAGPSPLLTIVVTDIVGSTAIARRLGDIAYASLIEDFRAAVRLCARNHRGREHAHTGDGFIHLFDSPADALAGAVAVFHTNRQRNVFRAEAIALRGGIHCGRLVRSTTGPIGIALNEACELGQNASAGELWLSEAAHTALDGAGGAGRTVELPKSGARRIHELAWTPWLEARPPAEPAVSDAA